MAGRLGPRLPAPKTRPNATSQTGGDPHQVHVSGHGNMSQDEAEQLLPHLLDLKDIAGQPIAALHAFHHEARGSAASDMYSNLEA